MCSAQKTPAFVRACRFACAATRRAGPCAPARRPKPKKGGASGTIGGKQAGPARGARAQTARAPFCFGLPHRHHHAFCRLTAAGAAVAPQKGRRARPVRALPPAPGPGPQPEKRTQQNPRPRVPGLGVLLSSGRGPVALFSAVRGFAQKSKAHPAVCAKPKPTSLAGGCPAMGFMLPSSATAGGLQSLHGHRAPDDWLVGFNVGATNRTGQAVAAFRARRRAGRPVKKRGGGAPRRVTARYRTALPGARQTPRSPRPALHHPLQCPKTLRRFLPSRA